VARTCRDVPCRRNRGGFEQRWSSARAERQGDSERSVTASERAPGPAHFDTTVAGTPGDGDGRRLSRGPQDDTAARGSTCRSGSALICLREHPETGDRVATISATSGACASRACPALDPHTASRCAANTARTGPAKAEPEATTRGRRNDAGGQRVLTPDRAGSSVAEGIDDHAERRLPAIKRYE